MHWWPARSRALNKTTQDKCRVRSELNRCHQGSHSVTPKPQKTCPRSRQSSRERAISAQSPRCRWLQNRSSGCSHFIQRLLEGRRGRSWPQIFCQRLHWQEGPLFVGLESLRFLMLGEFHRRGGSHHRELVVGLQPRADGGANQRGYVRRRRGASKIVSTGFLKLVCVHLTRRQIGFMMSQQSRGAVRGSMVYRSCARNDCS